MIDQSPLRRGEPRSEVTQNEVHGIASRSQGREQGPFILWDISDRGLRLWVPQRVAVGEVLRLTIAKPFVVMCNCEVRWVKPLEEENGFQIGVRVLDNQTRVEALHRNLSDEDTGLKLAADADPEDDPTYIPSP